MPTLINALLPTPRRGLIITAAPAETSAVLTAVGIAPTDACVDWHEHILSPRWSLVQSGVGKVNAALCAARLVDPARHALVLNVGVCGSLPAQRPAALLDLILADRSVYADEGIAIPDGYIDIAAAGFGPGGAPPAFPGVGLDTDEQLRDALAHALTAARLFPLIGPIATVSTCSGSDPLAHAIAARTGASAEAMEGAAIAHALARLHPGTIRFAELRVVSNTTGDRARQQWNLKGALAVLSNACRAVIA